MNPDLARLQPYPFERIRTLLAGLTPAALPSVSLAIQAQAPDAGFHPSGY